MTIQFKLGRKGREYIKEERDSEKVEESTTEDCYSCVLVGLGCKDKSGD